MATKKKAKKLTPTALLRFVQRVADLNKDGECLECGLDGFEPNPDCPGKHEAFDLENDDAVDMLHYCISEARRVLGRTN